MNTIKSYIDNLFDQLPQTSEVLQLKNDLVLNMEDKYDELIAEGKIENEAIGIVIAEFGNIDELKESLGIKQVSSSSQEDEVYDKEIWEVADVREFIDNKKRATRFIAIGVALIILGGALLIALSEMTVNENIGVAVLLIFVAIGVALFIYANSVGNARFFAAETTMLSHSARDYVHTYEHEKNKQSMVPNIIGVLLCILSALFVILPGEALQDKYANYFVALLLCTVAIAVYLFITFNNYKSAMDILLNRGEISYSPHQKRNQHIYRSVTSIWWLLTTAIYLVYSFFIGSWHISWIIWPVSALIYAVISIVIKMFFGEEE